MEQIGGSELKGIGVQRMREFDGLLVRCQGVVPGCDGNREG